MNKKNIITMLFACSIIMGKTIGMELEQDPNQPQNNNNVQLNKMEHRLQQAAQSWGMSFEDFKQEALKFVDQYKKNNTYSHISLQDLMIFNKPVFTQNQKNTIKEQFGEDTLNQLIENQNKAPKFGIPN